MYRNIKNSRVQQTRMLVPIDAVEQIVKNITNPVKVEKPIQADGGAYRAYCFNILNPKNKNQ